MGIEERQVAAGGGVVASSLAATQMATVTYVGSLFTVGTSTGATWIDVTQTFATTPLGPSYAVQTGSIGLGTIAGTVGEVKTK